MRFSRTVSVANTERPSGAWATPGAGEVLGRAARDVAPVDQHPPLGRDHQARRDAGERGLAHAVVADDRDRAAGRQLERQAEQRLEPPVARR